MHRFPRSFGSLFLGLVVACAPTAAFTADEPVIEARQTAPAHELPEDPHAPVILLDYKGGLTPRKQNDDPTLVIRADGTVVLGDKFGRLAKIESKLSREELQELLHFILVEQHVAEYDPQVVQDAIAKNGRKGRVAIADAATTELTIHADGEEVTVQRYALSFEARRYPTVEPLQQLVAVQRRLEHLRSVLYAGGKQEVAKFVELVNRKLKELAPDFPPLSTDDLRYAQQMKNGDRKLNFFRNEPLAAGRARITNARIQVPAEGEPQVTVTTDLVERTK